MEILSFKSLAELGMDDPLLMEQWPVDSLEMIASVFCEEAESSQAYNRPLKHLTTTTSTLMKTKEEACFSSVMNHPSQSSFGNLNFVVGRNQAPHRLKTNTRQAQANDHILAERKRREKLSQKFIALSALIPGLKKIDKASVLGDAIKYLKQLQEKVEILEEQTNKRSSMETAVFVRKYLVFSNKDDHSSEISEQLPKIDARFWDKDVLIAIHCPKAKGMLEKTLIEIEKLHLSVVNSCAMSFGDSTLSITISAQKDEDFSMNIEQLVKNLRVALENIF